MQQYTEPEVFSSKVLEYLASENYSLSRPNTIDFSCFASCTPITHWCTTASHQRTMDLSKRLPAHKPFSTLHFRTNAYQCKSLTVSRPKNDTLKIKHLFLLIDQESKCVVFGIEIYVYLTFQGPDLTQHIFVLKADTTGLGSVRFSAAEVVLELVTYLIHLNPEEYYESAAFWNRNNEAIEASAGKKRKVDSSQRLDSVSDDSEYAIVNDLLSLSLKLKDDPKYLSGKLWFLGSSEENHSQEFPLPRPSRFSTKISLFTRAANAYIFPESDKNLGKHVATGNQLFAWWINLLSKTTDDKWVCKADIPGSEPRAIERFLPQKQNWSRGNIYVSSGGADIAIRAIPLFPDDPKGRFLEHLIVEGRYKGVSTSRYWDELGFRQEFRLGNVVGIIGCSNAITEISGNVEDLSTMIVTRKQYKKLQDLIKGEDYTKKEDIQHLCQSGIQDLAERLGVKMKENCLTGSRMPAEKTDTTQEAVRSNGVTNLTSLVKRKKKQT